MAFGGKLCYLMFHILWQNPVHVYVIVLKTVIFHVDLHLFPDQFRVAENAQAGAFEMCRTPWGSIYCTII